MVDKCYGQNGGKPKAQCSKEKWRTIIQGLFYQNKSDSPDNGHQNETNLCR